MDNYYIIVNNLCDRHSGEFSEYHIENVCHYDVGFIIDKELSSQKDNLLIITDDCDLLAKYIFCLSNEDFSLICNMSTANNEKIRINQLYFTKYSERTTITIDKENLHHYFLKVLSREIISASITTENKKYGYDDLGNCISAIESTGWKENHLFRYLDVPEHYATRNYPKNYEKNIHGKLLKISQPEYLYLEELNILVNTNITELEVSDNSVRDTWDYHRNGVYKYFDYKTYCRLYINDEIVDKIKKDDSLVLKCNTKFGKDKYIEYHIYDIVNS